MMSKPELVTVRASDIKPRRRYDESRWNGWRLEENFVLTYPAYPAGVYPVDLEELTSSAQMLDTIVQVAGKTWATAECVAGLVHALDDLLRPQANLCSFGKSKRITAARIRKSVTAQRRSR